MNEVFVQAGELRRIVGDVATQEFALLRLLLAILHDAIAGPEDLDAWQELWDTGLPVDDVAAYLEEHRGRFDLLHPHTPFFQTVGLRTARDEVFSLDRIVADVPNGELFFTMRAHGVERLGFGEAARWVVHAHAYDTSGIKTGAVGDIRVKSGKVYPQGTGWAGNLGGVFVEGDNLRETLLLNLIAFDTDTLRINSGDDRPAWRHDPTGPGETPAMTGRPFGPRDLYTWQSRRIRLHFDADGVYGVVLAYGDPLAAGNKHRHEPMTAWRRSPAQEMKTGQAQVYLPRSHDPSRSAWRELGALVAGRVPGAEQRDEAATIVRPRILDWVARLTVEGDLPAKFFIRARLIGAIYGTQQSVIDEIVDDTVTMPIVLLHKKDDRLGQAAINAVSDAEAAVTALGKLAADLATAAGAASDPPNETARFLGFGTLDGPLRAWLATLTPGDTAHVRRADWQQQAHQLVRRLGAKLVRETGDARGQGRVIETRNGQKIWLESEYAFESFDDRLGEIFSISRNPHGESENNRKIFSHIHGDTTTLAPVKRTTISSISPWQEYDVRDAVCDAAGEYVAELQRDFRKSVGSTVARIAQLKKGAGTLPMHAPELWGLYGVDRIHQLQDLNDIETHRADVAMFVTVTLYALHQQSHKQRAMHRPSSNLGAAVRLLMGAELDESIRRRLVQIGTSSSMSVLAHNLRGMVQLLRAELLPLDYAQLAGQLYLAQSPGGLAEVRHAWARSFHAPRPAPAPQTRALRSASHDIDKDMP